MLFRIKANHCTVVGFFNFRLYWAATTPSQLAKENKKFIYNVLKKGARATEYELAIQWLIDAGIVWYF